MRLAATALLSALAGAAFTATAPIAVDDAVQASKNGLAVIDVLRNDPPGLGLTGVTNPAHGTVLIDNGRVRYTPTPGYVGTDSFTYSVRPGVAVGAVDRVAWQAFPGQATVWASGFGSAIAPVPGSSTDYYLLADRGPNVGGTGSNKVFAIPTYAPSIARVAPKVGGGYSVVSVLTLKRPVGTTLTLTQPASAALATLTGLPYTPNPGSEIPVDTTGTAILPASDPLGIDSEGLVALADGTFWVSDEYGPIMAHFDAAGVQLERIDPIAANGSGHKLPQVLKRRLLNKGMEGLTITPDGTKLVGLMQQPLVNFLTSSATGTSSDIDKTVACRIVVYTIATGASQEYAYLLDRTGSATPKTGNSEIAAISNTKFLIIERDGKFPDQSGATSVYKRIHEIDISSVSDIHEIADSDRGTLFTDGVVSGQTLEDVTYNKTTVSAQAALAALTPPVVPVTKRQVLDLTQLGNGAIYEHDKVEGLAVLSTTTDPTFGTVAAKIAIANDDDFGITDGASANTIAPKLSPQGVIDHNEILLVDLSQGAPASATAPYRRVLMLTIDGFRNADLADPALAVDLPNIIALKTAGITYTGASSPTPTDSFPGLLGLTTGAGPKNTGVYYDDTYTRDANLYPPGATVGSLPATPGARAPWIEIIDYNASKLDGGNPTPGVADVTSIDATKLP